MPFLPPIAACLPTDTKIDRLLIMALCMSSDRVAHFTTREQDKALRAVRPYGHFLYGPHACSYHSVAIPDIYGSPAMRRKLSKLLPQYTMAKWADKQVYEVAMIQLAEVNGDKPVEFFAHGDPTDDRYVQIAIKLAKKLKIPTIDVRNKPDVLKRRLKPELVELIGNTSIWKDSSETVSRLGTDQDFLSPQRLFDEDVPW